MVCCILCPRLIISLGSVPLWFKSTWFAVRLPPVQILAPPHFPSFVIGADYSFQRCCAIHIFLQWDDTLPTEWWGLYSFPLNLGRTLGLPWPIQDGRSVAMGLRRLGNKNAMCFHIVLFGIQAPSLKRVQLTQLERPGRRGHLQVFWLLAQLKCKTIAIINHWTCTCQEESLRGVYP